MPQGKLECRFHFNIRDLTVGTKLFFSWQRVRTLRGALLASVIKVQLVMVTHVLILMNAVQNSTIAVILESVLILKVASHVLVQTNISKEDIEEVVRKETAVKWMVEAIELVNVINNRSLQISTKYPYILTIFLSSM